MSTTDLGDLMKRATDELDERTWTAADLRDVADQRRTRRVRVWTAAALGAAAAVAGVAVVASLPDPAPPASTVTSGVAQGFPVGSAIEAAIPALPADVTIGELPMDIAWAGDQLDVPIVVAGGSDVLVLTVGATCTAEAASLDEQVLADVADAVCAARDTAASGGGAPLPGGGGPAS
jgi:hypothetical protein